MKQLIKAYSLFYIFMAIIWQPFQIYILKVDGAGRTIMIMSILVILVNLYEFWKQKKIYMSMAFLCWMVLFCYSMANAFSKGFYAEFGTFAFLRKHFFDSFVLLIILMLELKRDRQTCLWVIWAALSVYLLICLPYFSLNDEGRFDVEDVGNLLPLHAVSFLFVTSVLFIENKINRVFFWIIVAGISALILLSGTRKAFGAEAILLLGVILNDGKKRNLWSWVRIGVFGALLAVGVYYVVNNTSLGERILSSTEDDGFYVQLVDNQKINDFLMVLLGDRAGQYEMAIEFFHEHYWTGIGLTNYMDMSGGEMVLHPEYMVQLCENGMIGLVLLMLFYVWLIIALSISKRSNTSNKQGVGVSLFGLMTVMFLNLTGWSYNQNYIMIFYAIICMYAYFDRIKNDTNENSRTSQREQFQQSLDSIFGPAPDRV